MFILIILAGMFTAKIHGYYFLEVQILTQSDGGAQAVIRKESTDLCRLVRSSNHHFTISCSAIVELLVGDTTSVWAVKFAPKKVTEASFFGFFIGPVAPGA